MVEKRQAIDILEDLKAKIPSLSKLSPVGKPAFLRWHHSFETAIVQIFPNDSRYITKFNAITFIHSSKRVPGADETAVAFGLDVAEALLQAMIDEVRGYWSENGTLVNPHGQETREVSQSQQAKDQRTVFVVHGQNEQIRASMFGFLRALKLNPLEWEQARAGTGKPNPYVGEILDYAFSVAQAVVVLLTPDDEARLRKEFQTEDEPLHETMLTGQAQPNVLFESGMAMGRNPDRTVLVEIGQLRQFSDIGGRHLLRLDNSPHKRKELADRLKTAGCPVDYSGTDWLKEGSFEIPDQEKPLEKTDAATTPSQIENRELAQMPSPAAAPLPVRPPNERFAACRRRRHAGGIPHITAGGVRLDPERGSLAAYLFGIARKLLLRQFERRRSDVGLDTVAEEAGSAELADASDPLADLTARNTFKRCAGR